MGIIAWTHFTIMSLSPRMIDFEGTPEAKSHNRRALFICTLISVAFIIELIRLCFDFPLWKNNELYSCIAIQFGAMFQVLLCVIFALQPFVLPYGYIYDLRKSKV
jgi:hypothetical protein